MFVTGTLNSLRKGLSKEALIEKIEGTLSIVDRTLSSLEDEILSKEYPIKVFSEPMITGYFLIHLAGHLNYHLGQINYHRRLLDANKRTDLIYSNRIDNKIKINPFR
jgi:hypothetical protein